jgi:hypothetical protein
MNNSLQSVFRNLLHDTGFDKPAPLGSRPKYLSAEERNLLITSLTRAGKWNGVLAVVLLVAIAILLIFSLVVAWYLRDTPSSFEKILGGSLLGLILLLGWFAHVWKEKHRMDMLRAVLPLLNLDKLTELAFGFASGDLKSINQLGREDA